MRGSDCVPRHQCRGQAGQDLRSNAGDPDELRHPFALIGLGNYRRHRHRADRPPGVKEDVCGNIGPNTHTSKASGLRCPLTSSCCCRELARLGECIMLELSGKFRQFPRWFLQLLKAIGLRSNRRPSGVLVKAFLITSLRQSQRIFSRAKNRFRGLSFAEAPLNAISRFNWSPNRPTEAAISKRLAKIVLRSVRIWSGQLQMETVYEVC